MTAPLFTISRKVDLLVIDNKIITDNTKLMQSHFGFHDFIRSSAKKTIESIERLQLVKNIDKLEDYIGRGKIGYAKKMMRIKNSKVLELSKSQILHKIRTLQRWQGKFEIKRGKIILSTFTQVESLIELLDEKYTRSDVTGKEYATDVKKLADPVSA